MSDRFAVSGGPGADVDTKLHEGGGLPEGAGEERSPPGICRLEHPGFVAMGPPTFRRSDSDGQVVMTVALGTQQAVFPVPALKRALGIIDDSADGRMLALITEALDFVNTLQLGEALPSEVVTGQASWSPGPRHYALASARLRMNLVAWLGRQEGHSGNPDPAALLALVEDPGFRPRLQAAFRSAATALGLNEPEAVIGLLSRLSDELAYIEAMRERLLDRVQRMADQISWVARTGRCGWQRGEMILAVRRLMAEALESHRQQFESIDRQTGHVVDALRDLEQGQLGVRSWRDGMFTSLRKWEALMTSWETCRHLGDTDLARLVDRTYRFLARRSMPGEAWSASASPERPRPTPR
jgi:hypothetical protein